MSNTSYDRSELVRRLSKPKPGGVILFTGAGFSDKTNNTSGVQIPFSRDFAATLASNLGEDINVALDVIADLYEMQNPNRSFVNLILDTFTASSFESFHKTILDYPWKRIYTTNYDDVAELVIGRSRNLPSVFTRNTLPLTLSRDELQIIHLNGYVKASNSKTIVDDFALTLTRYVEASLFESRWATLLRQDFQLADTIIFIGYSMYDLDISRILTADPLIRAKTFVIQHENLSRGSELHLQRYGNLLKIGLPGFSDIIENVIASGIVSPVSGLENFSECLPVQSPEIYTVRTRDVELLLERGVFDERINSSIFTKESSPYLVRRRITDQILKSLEKDNSSVVVHSDIGNGKSILIEQVRLRALVAGYRVFNYVSKLDNLSFDIEFLNKVEEKSIIIIEDLLTNRDIIDSMRERLKNFRILSSVRSSIFEVKSSDIKQILGSDFATIDANILDKSDYADLTAILTKGGYWGDLQNKTIKEKYKYIEKNVALNSGQ